MASYLQVNNISKSYGHRVLFENISFNINEGNKIALIGPNGCGKTSLLRILAGKDKSDSGGSVIFLKNIRTEFLEQKYPFDPEMTVRQDIMSKSEDFISGLEQEQIWHFEHLVEKNLSIFGIDPSKKMKELSGGETKRVAICSMLSKEPDFMILDEPTNHLDIDAIEALENILCRSRSTVLMVTHDRYFLNKVCNTILEIDHGALYQYSGTYEQYLEKRDERISNFNAETDKVRNILRRELEWFRSTPQARTGKARYRINAFYDLRERASVTHTDKEIDMSGLGGSRLGTKIFDCEKVCFSYGNKTILRDFTYKFQRYERVGIVGGNGAGKSTFLNLLTGATAPDSGTVERGESINVGYYHQSGITKAGFRDDNTVLETVSDTSLLNRFLFPRDMLNTRLEKLSGGELRRLYLLSILIKAPNVLILDEPTNDLDIVTLNILEEYLKDFKGTLIIVSHDRHFLDRLADHLFIFCGDGIVKDFTGNYSEYREFITEYENSKTARPQQKNENREWRQPKAERKLSYKEKTELQTLETEIENLYREKKELEDRITQGNMKYEEITSVSERIGEIISSLEIKENRWIELSSI